MERYLMARTARVEGCTAASASPRVRSAHRATGSVRQAGDHPALSTDEAVPPNRRGFGHRGAGSSARCAWGTGCSIPGRPTPLQCCPGCLRGRRQGWGGRLGLARKCDPAARACCQLLASRAAA